MMNKMLIAVMIFAGVLISSIAHTDDAQSVFSYSYYVSTDSPENVIKNVRAFVPSKKGYVGYFSNDRISVRIPVSEVGNLRRLLSDLGYVIGENQKRQDLSLTMLDLQTRLSTKQKLLAELNGISSLRLAETLQVEQEMNRVIAEIEDLKGKIVYYRDRIALSEVTIYLNRAYTSSGSLPQNVPALWMLRLGLENLLRE